MYWGIVPGNIVTSGESGGLVGGHSKSTLIEEERSSH